MKYIKYLKIDGKIINNACYITGVGGGLVRYRHLDNSTLLNVVGYEDVEIGIFDTDTGEYSIITELDGLSSSNDLLQSQRGCLVISDCMMYLYNNVDCDDILSFFGYLYSQECCLKLTDKSLRLLLPYKVLHCSYVGTKSDFERCLLKSEIVIGHSFRRYSDAVNNECNV